MELYTFEGQIITKLDLSELEIEYYANKTCRTCWGKGYIEASFPKKFSNINQICSCAKKRYLKNRG